jgi:EEF1A lysine methyltransferase 1
MKYPEKDMLNQYWFSENTVSVLMSEVISLHAQGFCRIACISTPSIYFSLPEEIRKTANVFDIDTEFQKDPGFVHYDFNAPESIPREFHRYFDVIIIDPPFITKEVWEKYTSTIVLMSNNNTKIILSSIAENSQMLQDLLQVYPCAFQPSIPHLVYQYNFYTNYRSDILSQINSEIPID